MDKRITVRHRETGEEGTVLESEYNKTPDLFEKRISVREKSDQKRAGTIFEGDYNPDLYDKFETGVWGHLKKGAAEGVGTYPELIRGISVAQSPLEDLINPSAKEGRDLLAQGAEYMKGRAVDVENEGLLGKAEEAAGSLVAETPKYLAFGAAGPLGLGAMSGLESLGRGEPWQDVAGNAALGAVGAKILGKVGKTLPFVKKLGAQGLAMAGFSPVADIGMSLAHGEGMPPTERLLEDAVSGATQGVGMGLGMGSYEKVADRVKLAAELGKSRAMKTWKSIEGQPEEVGIGIPGGPFQEVTPESNLSYPQGSYGMPYQIGQLIVKTPEGQIPPEIQGKMAGGQYVSPEEASLDDLYNFMSTGVQSNRGLGETITRTPAGEVRYRGGKPTTSAVGEEIGPVLDTSFFTRGTPAFMKEGRYIQPDELLPNLAAPKELPALPEQASPSAYGEAVAQPEPLENMIARGRIREEFPQSQLDIQAPIAGLLEAPKMKGPTSLEELANQGIEDLGLPSRTLSEGHEKHTPIMINDASTPKLDTDYMSKMSDEAQAETVNQLRILSGKPKRSMVAPFTEKINDLANTFGAVGGELGQEGWKADREARKIQGRYENPLNKIEDIASELHDHSRQKAYDNVIKALQDRANADSILKTPAEREMYKQGITIFEDAHQTYLAPRDVGYEENYYRHAKDVITNPDAYVGPNAVPKELKPGFIEERKGGWQGYSRDFPKIIRNYVHSLSGWIANEPLMDYYHETFIPEAIKGGMTPEKVNLHRDFMKRFFESRPLTKGEGWFHKNIITRAYRSALAWNSRSAIKNWAQRFWASSKVSSEAARMVDPVGLASEQIPELGSFLKEGADPVLEQYNEDTVLIPKEGMNLKNGTFQFSEGGNWNWSRIHGVAQEVVLSKDFKAMVKSGIPRVVAAERILSDPAFMKKAMNRGESLMQETQFAPSKATEPDAFMDARKNIVTRSLAMFQRYKVGLLEMLFNTFSPKGKELSILRRGQSPEASIVDRMRELRLYSEAAKQAMKVRPDLKDDFNLFRKVIKNDLKTFGKQINEFEPTNKKKMAATLAASIAFQTGVDLLWQTAGDKLREQLGMPERKKRNLAEVVASNTPGLDIVSGGGKFSAPYMPALTGAYGGVLKPKAYGRAAIKMGIMAVPPLSYLNTAIPGSLVQSGLEKMFNVEPQK